MPDGALFCPWCGEKLVRAKKKKAAPKCPKFNAGAILTSRCEFILPEYEIAQGERNGEV